jgi:hypothetical protein
VGEETMESEDDDEEREEEEEEEGRVCERCQ